MARQRLHRVSMRVGARSAASAIEVQLGDEDRVLPRRAAPLGDAPAPAGPTTPIGASPSTRHARRLARDQKRRGRPARSATTTPSASHSRSTTPLTSKKSTSRPLPDQCSAPPAPVQASADAARFAAVAREARADLEQRDVAPAVPPVVRDGVDEARQQRRPQHVELRRQRVGDADQCRRRRRPAQTPGPPRLR